MHVLDNPAWHALAGPHATVAERTSLAARYAPDVSVFAALPDEISPDAWDDLREVVGPGGNAFLARRELTVPESWTIQFNSPCRQMWLPDADDAPARSTRSEHSFELLGPSDVPAMLSLVERTRPGPFVARTIELGTYIGVRHGDALVAMAGERMHPAGFTEISAVCTDSSHRGRGLASQLVRALVRRIHARNEQAFLHLTLQNEAALRVYSELGFETRASLEVIGLRAPS